MRKNGRQGSIMIVVLLVLAAAAYLIMESGKSLRINYEGAAAQRMLATGGSLLRSGVAIAREVLMEDLRKTKDNADTRFDNWADPDLYKRLTAGLSSGDLNGAIVAEDGKIPINSFLSGSGVGKALGEIFVRLVSRLAQAHGIEAKATDYLTSIQIWMGKKDTQGDQQWYAGEAPPYTLAKGKFHSPHELLLVRWKGVDMDGRRKVLYGANGVPGLIEFITVWGQGRINMNVAPLEVVAAVCPEPHLLEDFVSSIEAYRKDGANSFTSSWYKVIASNVGITLKKFPDKGLTFKSTVFRVSLEAEVGAGTIRSTSILQRNGTNCVVLFENIH